MWYDLLNALHCSGHILNVPYPILGMKRDGQLEVYDVNINVPSVPNGQPGQPVELRGHQHLWSYHTTSQ